MLFEKPEVNGDSRSFTIRGHPGKMFVELISEENMNNHRHSYLVLDKVKLNHGHPVTPSCKTPIYPIEPRLYSQLIEVNLGQLVEYKVHNYPYYHVESIEFRIINSDEQIMDDFEVRYFVL